MGWLSDVWNSWRKRATAEVKNTAKAEIERTVKKLVKQNLFVLKVTIEDIDEPRARQKLANELGLTAIESTGGGNWKAKTKTGISVLITHTSV